MLLFKDTRPNATRPSDPRADDEPGARTGGPRIRCPRCAWEPRREDRWGCLCGWIWHTFDTAGRCPSCDRQWEETQCLHCKQWSPHRDWYAEEDGDEGGPPSSRKRP